MNAIRALFLAFLVLTLSMDTVEAAPAQRCLAGEDVDTSDMSGIYEETNMHMIIDQCGNMRLLWRNAWGNHVAYYYAVTRAVRGGGVLYYGGLPDPSSNNYMDATDVLVVRPAEPQWVTVETLTPDFARTKGKYRVYRWEDLP